MKDQTETIRNIQETNVKIVIGIDKAEETVVLMERNEFMRIVMMYITIVVLGIAIVGVIVIPKL
jgi:hypothetical protein